MTSESLLHGSRHLVLTPRAQRRRGPRPKHLRLLTVALEGMSGNEEPHDRFFSRQPLRLRPWRDIGQTRPRHPVLITRRPLSKQGGLTSVPFGLPQLRLAKRRVQPGEELRAVPTRLVERTRGDERFHDALVA